MTIYIRLCCQYLILASSLLVASQRTDCRKLTTEKTKQLITYLADAFELPLDLKLTDEGLLEGSCTRHLVASYGEKQSKDFYLSPDSNWLYTGASNLTADPRMIEIASGRLASLDLLRDPSPTLGDDKAPITIVVFSDFECPYCKRFSLQLKQLSEQWRRKLRVVFKQMPLEQHPWAKRAAISSTCIYLLRPDLFWTFEGFLFEHQDQIIQPTFESSISGFILPKLSEVERSQYGTCVHSEKPKEIVLRDRLLAEHFKIDSTPTVFINGIRRGPFMSTDSLEVALARALE